ncbi:NACHT, LRR and PYD domains-containing protein 14 isoform X2 [Bubalus kerabau]|uniref:NACHT, LRR and PYD domains-containing protein 14 isoform X2 n=1 Tax=Bubalus carabanensis TaxID=3119969 RepID=UPI00244EC018|nr:NACHT, LRR and PYD domains-containing protein 14 isoform X2 [Bubalus carabanensis]
MTHLLSSSFFSDFGLLLYLEELNKEELIRFKSLLKNETLEPRSCRIPWSEVKKAKRKDLADLMSKYYPGEQAWKVALSIFGKMNLKDLCERAKAEINWTARAMRTEDTEAREVQGDQEAMLGDGAEYRIQIREKFRIMLDKNHLLGKSEDFCHEIAQEGRELLERLFGEEVGTEEQPQTVVLQGAAGIGKTTLVRMMMLDWAQGNLYQQKFTHVFYLNAREINQLRERSFVQLLSKDWPSTEGPIERIMSQPSRLLFIIDSFDELNFAFEEPEFVLCADWTQVHPVSFLMSSLLRKVMLPESSLLVTTKLTAWRKLKPLLKNQHSIQLLGMSEDARQEYIYQFFEDQSWALQVFSSLRNNVMLFNMCKVPAVCWVVCNCLEQQMEKGGDITLTCKTATSLFACCISSLLTQVDRSFPGLPSQTQLRSLCHLAARGVWTMTYVFYKENLRRHGLVKSDVSIFLDTNILQKDTEYENCYVFTHLHIQEFFAAMFYVLEGNWDNRDDSLQSFENLELVLESSSYKDPHLLQMKCFLFGLLNEDRMKQLEETFNCTMSLEVKWTILQWMETLGSSEQLPSHLVFLELFFHLYETQDEVFVSQAMRYFQKVVINICEEIHLLLSSFCLKHCQCLRTMNLMVTGVFEKKMLNSSFPPETWQRSGSHIFHWWQDLCSVLHTNEHLREVILCHSNLDELAMKIFNQELRHPNCKLQKLRLRFTSFPDICQGISGSLTHNQNLIHLDLKGSDIGDDGVKSLCEALKHPDCKLQNLSLESCDLTTVCCLNISKALVRSQSLLSLNLSTNNLLDDGVKLLCEGLMHPKCNLEKLSLRRCHFTSLSSESLSTSLLHNKSLMHLDLGSNCLQDDGVKLLCDAFRHPSCNLQDLELMGCVLTSACCLDLASAILNNPNLQSLDLGNNDLQDDGVKFLFEALRHPNCNIQRLGLEHCGLTSLCCKDLSSTLSSNQSLIKISLTLNTLEREGIMKLSEVLRSTECKLQVLGLCKEALDEEAQKLLEAVASSNLRLAVKQDCNDHEEEDGSWWRCF